jgi:hypothetical protein
MAGPLPAWPRSKKTIEFTITVGSTPYQSLNRFSNILLKEWIDSTHVASISSHMNVNVGTLTLREEGIDLVLDVGPHADIRGLQEMMFVVAPEG